MPCFLVTITPSLRFSALDQPCQTPGFSQSCRGQSPSGCPLRRAVSPLWWRLGRQQSHLFYNREDLWQFPRQPGGDGTSMMTPYYIIMRLPGEPQAEFFLMLPMVPSRRDNMIAWLAARCDAPDYGKLIVYEFP